MRLNLAGPPCQAGDLGGVSGDPIVGLPGKRRRGRLRAGAVERREGDHWVALLVAIISLILPLVDAHMHGPSGYIGVSTVSFKMSASNPAARFCQSTDIAKRPQSLKTPST